MAAAGRGLRFCGFHERGTSGGESSCEEIRQRAGWVPSLGHASYGGGGGWNAPDPPGEYHHFPKKIRGHVRAGRANRRPGHQCVLEDFAVKKARSSKRKKSRELGYDQPRKGFRAQHMERSHQFTRSRWHTSGCCGVVSFPGVNGANYASCCIIRFHSSFFLSGAPQ